MNYNHDESFAILKKTNEQVSTNYTSSQYLKTLDHFLWMALGPIIQNCPTLFLNYVSKVVAQQVVRNNKMTSSSKDLLPVTYINVLLASNRTEAAKELHLNRGILFSFLYIFDNITAPYKALMERPPAIDALDYSTRLQRINQIEQDVGLLPHKNLYGIVLEVQYWYKQASDFKNVIVEKYTRLVLNSARRTYVDVQHQESLGDIIGIFMLTLSKAIDRCDSRHGVLTTFIMNWLRGARSQVMDSVRQTHATTSIEAQLEGITESNLHEHGTIDPHAEFESMQALSYIAKKIDPKGCIRASLGIPEFISNAQLKILEEHRIE